MIAHSELKLVEVGPRDGLQNIKTLVPTSIKLELIDRLVSAGLKTIELTSIVSPKAVPQMADCQDVLSSAAIQGLLESKSASHRFPVLVPNMEGLRASQKHEIREVAVFVSATEGFSKANINCTVRQGLDRARLVIAEAKKHGLEVRGYVSCIFADPYDGPTPLSAVTFVVKELFDAGCYEVSLGDTTGIGTPQLVRTLLARLVAAGVPVGKLAGHFHDTYGQALANIWEAYNNGIRVFDASVAGLGGCPFAPGAKGNVATEDVVYMFDKSGIETGVNLQHLAKTGVWICDQLGLPNSSRAGNTIAAREKLPNIAAEFPTLSWIPYENCDGPGKEILIYKSGANLKIVLNRPRNGNALTQSMIQSLCDIFDKAKIDQSIVRIVLTATGRFFCTGMDLDKNTSNVARSDASKAGEQYDLLTRLFDKIDGAPQVTIACVNGHAFGGGVGLAFACDIRLAISSVNMTLSEVRLGLCPAIISKYLIREWGIAFSREAMLSARPVSAKELLVRGLVSQVANTQDECVAMLDNYLQSLRVAAPGASAMCKKLVHLAYVDAGGIRQSSGVKTLFEKMMRADGESAFALDCFRSGTRSLDWDQLRLQKARPLAKL